MLNYICPLCAKPLHFAHNSYRCENNHCFDQAKEGYVNLLPVQYKRSKEPGDNKQMVQARRAFLNNGFYQPLVEHITARCQQYVPCGEILDAGCGEGYYTARHKTDSHQVYGVDIAKEAIRIAAKKYKGCHFSVGTLSQLPFDSQFFDWIYSIYAPILETEFTRLLKPKGYLLTVTPAEQHLKELKSLIYREAKEHNTDKTAIEHLSLVSEERLQYQIEFSQNEDLLNLLAMTPFAFKTSSELIETLKKMSFFTCTADFMIRLYQKAPEA